MGILKIHGRHKNASRDFVLVLLELNMFFVTTISSWAFFKI